MYFIRVMSLMCTKIIINALTCKYLACSAFLSRKSRDSAIHDHSVMIKKVYHVEYSKP